MIRRFVPILILFSLFLVGCGGSAAAPPAATLVQVTPLPADTAAPPTAVPPTPTAEPQPTHTPVVSLTEQMDAFVQAEADAGRFSGAMLMMDDGEILLSKGYGLAEREAGAPNTPTVRFPLGTLTIPFTAVAALQLVEQGKLGVEDPICDYLADCPEGWAGVQVDHLLTQSSGITGADTARYYGVATAEGDPPAALVESLSKSTPYFEPGSEWPGLQSSDFRLLGLVIEKVSGQSYASYMQDNIFGPLGMDNTGLSADPDNLAFGHADQPSLTQRPANLVDGYSATGLTTTLEDMARWSEALLKDQLITPETTEQMQDRHVDMGGGCHTGYGWFVCDFDGRYLSVSMPGPSVPGYHADMAYFPTEDLAWVLLANQEGVNSPYIGDSLVRMALAAEE